MKRTKSRGAACGLGAARNVACAPGRAGLALAGFLLSGPVHAQVPSVAQPVAAPLLNAHSHNDYLRVRPLEDALELGFCSVEADLVVVDGALLVAHEHATAHKARTLESLYLEPLSRRARLHGGRVHPNGPKGFRLLVDLKDEPALTWPLLAPILERFRDVLSSWQDGVLTERAIRIVFSGRAPRRELADLPLRLAAIDGGVDDEDASLYPLCSLPWTKQFRWSGAGPMPADEVAALRALVQRVHGQGRKLRFWRLPAKASVWQRLCDEGVDVLHTDDVRGLAAFLTERRLPPWPEGWRVEDGGQASVEGQACPPGIEVARFVRSEPPLHAVAVRCDLARGRFVLKPVLATNERREAKCSELARASGALALINASFFFWKDAGLEPNGAFVLDGRVVTAPKAAVEVREGRRFDVARGALILDEPFMPRFAWLSPDGDSETTWRAFVHAYAHGESVAASAAPPSCRLLVPEHVIGAGPMLLARGKDIARASALGERMFVHDKRHPRSVVATRGSVVWLICIDGRQAASLGATLDEVAAMLRELGANDALNLDGGGSSTLVWRSRVINRVSEGGVERKVPTALGIFEVAD